MFGEATGWVRRGLTVDAVPMQMLSGWSLTLHAGQNPDASVVGMPKFPEPTIRGGVARVTTKMPASFRGVSSANTQ